MKHALVFAEAPRRIYWEVTRACDLACRHCRAAAASEPSVGELTSEESLELIDRLAQFGDSGIHLVLTGGDPLKRSDLFALIDRARDRGFAVDVSPSGTPLLTPETLVALKHHRVGAISLSLDGATAARHDALRGVPGCFERTYDGAVGARAIDLRFQINTLASAETLPDLPAIHDLAARLGADRWSLFFLVAVGRGSILRPLDPDTTERVLAWLASMRGWPGPLVTTTEAPHYRRVCLERDRRGASSARLADPPARDRSSGIRDGNGIMFIAHDGDVFPSGFLPLRAGNVRSADPVAMYQTSPLFRSLRDVDRFRGRCGACPYRRLCGGSRARAFAASGDCLGEDPLCVFQPYRDDGMTGT